MRAVPIHLKEANKFVNKYHRHNLPTVSGKFAIAAVKDNEIVGVAIAGRPISRVLDDGKTLEIYRVCTDGTKNATSFLYSRCKRIGELMGYKKVITYTLKSESGSSLRAVNAKTEIEFKGRQWKNHKNGKREFQPVYDETKIRWAL